MDPLTILSTKISELSLSRTKHEAPGELDLRWRNPFAIRAVNTLIKKYGLPSCYDKNELGCAVWRNLKSPLSGLVLKSVLISDEPYNIRTGNRLITLEVTGITQSSPSVPSVPSVSDPYISQNQVGDTWVRCADLPEGILRLAQVKIGTSHIFKEWYSELVGEWNKFIEGTSESCEYLCLFEEFLVSPVEVVDFKSVGKISVPGLGAPAPLNNGNVSGTVGNGSLNVSNGVTSGGMNGVTSGGMGSGGMNGVTSGGMASGGMNGVTSGGMGSGSGSGSFLGNGRAPGRSSLPPSGATQFSYLPPSVPNLGGPTLPSIDQNSNRNPMSYSENMLQAGNDCKSPPGNVVNTFSGIPGYHPGLSSQAPVRVPESLKTITGYPFG